ncbi:hypothetical protein PBI_PEREGRIN_238 [Rhodococcus phage Peregrin]|nr:hypothetical protein PBI_PEREGRIN_238 [Rhodococcus phage Peregrin]
MPVNYKAMWNKLIGKPSNKHDLPLYGPITFITLRETIENDWKWTVRLSGTGGMRGHQDTINDAMARAIHFKSPDHPYHIKIHYRTKVT